MKRNRGGGSEQKAALPYLVHGLQGVTGYSRRQQQYVCRAGANGHPTLRSCPFTLPDADITRR